MSVLMIISTTLITLALLFYSIGVWSERIAHYLKMWHVVSFWIGFSFDVSGTITMSYLSDKSFNLLDIHTLTGQIALWLMLIHAIWASFVVKKKQETLGQKFHKYSIIVWLIWLIPYFGGMMMGMSK
jgi:uncharacterized repeat protein (TIGR03987 family)